jgi:hypothetical protein
MDPATKGRDAMSSIDSPSTPRRPRRRLAAWLAFGAIGLATGAVWATGFASTTAVVGTHTGSAAVTKTNPAAPIDSLANVASEVTPLAFDFTGRWGSVADTAMVKVDLSAEPAGNTYNVALLLSNTAALTGWASLQLKLEEVVASGAGGTTCVASDFDGTKNPQLMQFDAVDAGAYFNGLAGNAVYCLGINTSDGKDIAGTFLRSAQDASPSVFPTFLTTVDRAS